MNYRTVKTSDHFFPNNYTHLLNLLKQHFIIRNNTRTAIIFKIKKKKKKKRIIIKKINERHTHTQIYTKEDYKVARKKDFEKKKKPFFFNAIIPC